LEKSLPVSEATVFKNRDKFDIVVIYDDSSETHGDGPLSKLVTIVYEQAFSTILRNPPMLLLGGLKAWREEMGVDQVVLSAGVNGADTPETKLGSSSASQPASRFWTSTTNGTLPGASASPEHRLPERLDESPV